MPWPIILILVLAVPFLLFPLAFIWYVNIGGSYQALRQGQLKKAAQKLTCASDVDCPVGYICLNGKCVPAS